MRNIKYIDNERNKQEIIKGLVDEAIKGTEYENNDALKAFARTILEPVCKCLTLAELLDYDSKNILVDLYNFSIEKAEFDESVVASLVDSESKNVFNLVYIAFAIDCGCEDILEYDWLHNKMDDAQRLYHNYIDICEERKNNGKIGSVVRVLVNFDCKTHNSQRCFKYRVRKRFGNHAYLKSDKITLVGTFAYKTYNGYKGTIVLDMVDDGYIVEDITTRIGANAAKESHPWKKFKIVSIEY